ncbi:MAG: GNAT family acetyltransferase [Candidatus Melainabacteria bacterium RIFOXYA12_FULL_32_12]|nr:MAG: GNAT family acetyltransferase [Candidatus Melainabacteria bacterium RIFOXYA2_FULL_32_9]OGI28579.1 MAG: GNAT family acetyltransferase [Candidatus Melainabacteria bacterium RIFOXYA12_FULL_32_12]
MSKELDAIMRPKAIAVIGATERQGSLGRELVNNIIRYEFSGEIYLINPKSDTLFGKKTYKSVLDVPGQVDLAVIVIPNTLVSEAIDQCHEKGIKGVVIITAGYKETGAEGAKLEQDLVEKLHKYGMRAVGPNCMGVLNTDPSVRMNAQFAEDLPNPGKTAFVSQSGALGAAIITISKDFNIGLSQFVSVGNKADVNDATMLEYWEDDSNVDQILLYVESIENPVNFRQLASRISKKKPIVAVKSGRSAAGAKAASSHTGALAGADLAADALLKQSGVIRVTSILELFEVAQIFTTSPIPKGNRVAIITNTGGPGIMATDALSEYGLQIAELKEETQNKMKEFLPAAASVRNPVDMIASAPIEHYTKCLDIILKDENVDMVMIIALPFMGQNPMEIANGIMDMKKQHPDKPIVNVFITSREFFGKISKEKVNTPFYAYPESAAKAMARLDYYRRWLERPVGNEPKFEVDCNKAKEIIKNALEEGRDQLTTLESIDVLDAYGIRTCKYAFAKGEDEAAKVANEIEYPVVMKITSTKISHKTEIGGVMVDIKSEEELRKAYKGLLERLKERNLEDALDGVIIQEMVKGSREMVCGVATDPQYGHLMMFGLGGIFVESIKDVAFRINPLTDIDAKEMIESVKAYKILKGSRGEIPANIDQIQETLLRLSQLIKDFSFIEELDINPLKISDKTGLGIAVDGRIKVKVEAAKKALSNCCSSGACCV